MVTIHFYNFQKSKNSTKTPSGQGTVISGNMEEPFGVERFTVVLKIKRTDATTATVTMPQYNYAKVDNFSRFYFVTNWRQDAGYFYADFNADPLASYKTYIGSTSQYILRADEEYENENLIDSLSTASAGKNVSINAFYKLPLGSSIYGYDWTPFGGIVPGTGDIKYKNVIMIVNIDRIKYVGTQTPSYPYDAFVILQTDYDEFSSFVNKISARFGTDFAVKTVAAAYFCPLVYDNLAGDRDKFVPVERVYLANLAAFDEWTGNDYVDIDAYRLMEKKTFAQFLAAIPDRPPNSKSWQYSSVGRSFMVCGQPFGSAKLDQDAFYLGKNVNGLILTFEMDNFSGSTKVLTTPLVNGQKVTSRENMYFTTVNLYANLPYASSGVANVWEKNMAYISAPVQVFNSAAAGAHAGTAGGIPGMIAGGIIGGVVGSAGAVVGIANAELRNIERSINCGDLTMGDRPPYLETDDKVFTAAPVEIFGAPLCRYGQISNYPGFLLCQNPHIETAGNMTQTEAEQITSFLASGFYYE